MNLSTAKTMLRYAKQYVDLGQLRVVQTKEDWIYLINEQAIGVALYETEDEKDWNRWMSNYIEEEFNFDIAPEHMEIFSLFHELGHHIVGNICTDEEYYMLYQQIGPNDDYAYRQIPDEREADKWAISFLKEHMNDLLELYK